MSRNFVDQRALCTVLVALKERADWTPFFLEWSVHPEFSYLFLDGGSTDANLEIFRGEKRDNVSYRRTPPDVSVLIYLDKIIAGLESIETPYVLLADNDDLVLRSGMQEALVLLEDNSRVICAGGPIAGVTIKGPNANRCSWPMAYSDPRALDGLEGLSTVETVRRHHVTLWNMIFRREALLRGFKRAREMELPELHLIEFAVTDVAVASGVVNFQPTAHYVRIEQQTNRALNEVQISDEWRVGSGSWLSAHDQILKGQDTNPNLPSGQYRANLVHNDVDYTLAARGLRALRRRLSVPQAMPLFCLVAYLRAAPPLPLPRFPMPRNP